MFRSRIFVSKALFVIAAAVAAAPLALLSSCDGARAASPPAAERSPSTQPASVTPKTQAPDVAKTLSAAFAATAKAVRPSVVRIDVEGAKQPIAEQRRPRPQNDDDGESWPDGLPRMFRRFFDFGQAPDFPEAPVPGAVSRTGSGFLFDSSGDVITNSHVVDGATEVRVTLWDEEEIPAKVIGRDRRTDVAVVRLARLPKNLTAARIGDSSKVEVGEWVLAVGSPLGLEQTVTAGIVSGKGHVGRFVQMSGDRVREYIQTDAKINPGDSGGPLVDLEGQVIGVNTLIRTGAGGAYGFAIPINEARRVAQALMKDGKIRYPYLGVMVRDLQSLDEAARVRLGRAAPSEGAYVGEVTAGSPAAAAGLVAGDVITRLDGEPIKNSGDVVDYVSSRAIGATVTATVFRQGATRELRTTLAEAPGETRQNAEQQRAVIGPLGMSLQTLTPNLAESLGLARETKGAAITEVVPGSAAAKAGLEPGDVLLEIDRRPVASADDARGALGSRSGSHLLRVHGPSSGYRFVTVTD